MPYAIIVQRSRDYDKVFLYQKGVKRETGLYCERPTVDYYGVPFWYKNVGDVVYCLWTAIFEKYNLLIANCKDFARDLFNELYPGIDLERSMDTMRSYCSMGMDSGPDY